MIRIEGLTKRFGDRAAIDKLDLEVGSGELFALLGPNGAGKTTTLNCLLGFVTPDAGTVTVAGINPATDAEKARRHLAYIPEQVSLYPDFSGTENLAYFAQLSGHPRSAAELADLLDEVGLQRDAHGRRLGTYSKGMRQKVGLAIALARQAEVLLLDEPTSGLDPAASREFSAALMRLRERGVAILMATHDLFRARQDATRIGILANGRLIRSYGGSDLAADELEAAYVEAISAEPVSVP